MGRMVADCRDIPSESGCTLTIAGEEDEVVDAAARHAVAVHQHDDGPELREQIRGSLKPEMSGQYFQMIEMSTGEFDEFERLHEKWLAATEGRRTVMQEWILRDRERPDTYLVMVEFPSAEAAAVNNDLPATGEIAEGMAALAAEPPTFRNLDLVRRS